MTRARAERGLVTSSAGSLWVSTVVSVLLVAAGSSSTVGPSVTVALTLLGAVALASVSGAVRRAGGRVTAALLVVVTRGHRRPRVRGPVRLRQQDPRAPGRPKPRAPGATPLPSTA